jgi:hypothetical protein
MRPKYMEVIKLHWIRLRSHRDGKMKMNADGSLPRDSKGIETYRIYQKLVGWFSYAAYFILQRA